jgi:hypothetical protein
VLDIEINLKGGELDQADLTAVSAAQGCTPNIPVRLLSREPPVDSLYLLQTGSDRRQRRSRAHASGDLDVA